MKSTKWMFASVLGILMLSGNFALAQGHGNGHGKGHAKHGDDDEQDEQFYKDHDRQVIGAWYDEHQSNLPPGACKERSASPWIGKTTGKTRHAAAGTAETAATLSRRARAKATTATS